MKNNLLDIAINAKTLLSVRDKMLDECGFVAYRDVDRENDGYWLKKSFPGKATQNISLGLYIKAGKGISITVNTMTKYTVLEGACSFEAVMNQIDVFLTELVGSDWEH